MTQKEFETRTNILGNEAFDYANRVYMAAGQMDKDDFCTEWKKQTIRESNIVNALTMEVETLQRQAKANHDALEGTLKLQDELAYFIADMAHLAFNAIGNGNELRKKAVEVLGKREYLKHVITKGYELEQYDIEDLVNILSKED